MVFTSDRVELSLPPSTPTRATPTAMTFCCDVTTFPSIIVVDGSEMVPLDNPFEDTSTPGVAEVCWKYEKIAVGLAIMTTPTRDKEVAICSVRVNGSFRIYAQTPHAIMGERNVMTVVSANGRYMRL
jgi:hypothetical protein